MLRQYLDSISFEIVPYSALQILHSSQRWRSGTSFKWSHTFFVILSLSQDGVHFFLISQSEASRSDRNQVINGADKEKEYFSLPKSRYLRVL